MKNRMKIWTKNSLYLSPLFFSELPYLRPIVRLKLGLSNSLSGKPARHVTVANPMVDIHFCCVYCGLPLFLHANEQIDYLMKAT